MELSDCLRAYIIVVSLRIHSTDLVLSVQATRRLSRFPCEELPYVHGVSDHAGVRDALALGERPGVAFQGHQTLSAPPIVLAFRGSIPSPYVPLSTLRRILADTDA